MIYYFSRCLGWTLYKMLTLEDNYFELKDTVDFNNFQPKSLQQFDYSPELDAIFKKFYHFILTFLFLAIVFYVFIFYKYIA